MLHLVFRLGNERYVLASANIVEVLPVPVLRAIPGVPETVPGVFRYRGTLVPVLDLGLLVNGQPVAREKSRIALVRYGAQGDAFRLLGLLVEAATGLLSLREQEFTASPVTSSARYAGPVATDSIGMLQRIELEQLVPDDLWERLRPQSETVPE